MQRAIAILLLASLTFGAWAADGDEPPPTRHGLDRVPDPKVALAYERAGTDWSKYRTIQLHTLIFPPKARNGKPRGATSGPHESYVLRDQDVAALQKAYDEAMRDKLRGRYTFVSVPQADTLIVIAQIVEIELAAPIESSRMNYAGSGRTYSAGGGSITIAAVLADGATDQVIGEALDRKYAIDIWGVNNRVSNLAEARQIFGTWGRALRDKLGESAPR